MSGESPVERTRGLVVRLHRLGADPGLLEKVSSHLPANCDNPNHWAELALALRRVRNYGAAELVYKTALEVFTTSSRLWNNYAVLLRDWGKLAEALAACDRAIEVDPSYSQALANKGKIYELLHEFAKARSCYQAALSLDPGNAGTANNIGVCFLGEGAVDAAEMWFEKTLLLDPAWTDALFNLTAIKLDKNDFESAQRLLDRLVQLLPEDPEVEKLQALLRDGNNQRLGIELPPGQKLESDLSPELRKLCDELAGNPRSIFISYAWPDPSIKRFAARLSQDLKSCSFQVVLDQELGLEVHEVLVLLLHCQNVVVLNDLHYAESCLLGKVPITKTTSIYPSFAFPRAEAKSERYLGEVFKISAVAWDLAKRVKSQEIAADRLAFEFARPDAFKNVPGLRLFIEGWRVDEIQMVFANIKRFRSISVAYLGGEHCLAGYPLFDFSKEEYYPISFAALIKVLGLGRQLRESDAPIEFNDPNWSNYRWKDSSITSAKLWKIASEDVAVWRPSITPSGEAAAAINYFKDWNPI